jgi:hypothetical protein
MPGLLTLKTDLKSLKYGHDTPGGGDSGQPYIKTDINSTDATINKVRLTKFDDGLIRGGVIGATNAAVTDTLRIGKFLTDFPKGPLFIIKQVGLQLTNPRVESSILPTRRPTSGQGTVTNVINFVSNVANKIENAVGPTRIYNLGINTLAQVPVNAIGGHIVRHGFLPNNDSSKYYENVVKIKNFQNDSNRLLDLTNNFNLGPWGANKLGVTKKEQGILNKLAGIVSTNPMGSAIFGAATAIFNTNKEFEIDSYLGGANSVYGIGTTTIHRAMDGDTENKTKIDFSREQSKMFAGKTRDSKNNPTEVEELQRLTGASNKTESLFSDMEFPGISGSINPNTTFPFYYAKSNDGHGTNTVNAKLAYDNANNKARQVPLTNFVGASTYASSAYAPSGSVLTDNSGILNSLNAMVGSDLDKHGVNQIYAALSYNEVEVKASAVPLVDFIGVSTYSSSKYAVPNSTLTDTSGIPNLLGGVDATDADKHASQSAHLYDSYNYTTNNLGSILGLSNLDPAILTSSLDATIYDNTVVPYTDVQPSLRKFSELTAEIDKLSSPNNLGIYDPLIYGTGTQPVNGERLPTSQYNPTYTNGYGKVVTVGIPWINATREKRIGSGRKDEINLTPIFNESAYFGSDVVGTHNIRDLVKFRIQAVNTDGPGSGEWMVFRAYLTDLSDNVDATWNEVKYAGRGDKFWIYDSFSRKISVSFKVAALSAQEMKPMYQKLNFLMSNLMPDYKGVLMRGPLVRLMVGNYIDSQLGKLDSLSYKIPQDSPWEIAIDEPEGGTKLLILPHVVEVTLGFTPIGSDTAGANKLAEKSQTTSHIAQNNTGDTQFQYIQ